jgi:hypothetical protein
LFFYEKLIPLLTLNMNTLKIIQNKTTQTMKKELVSNLNLAAIALVSGLLFSTFTGCKIEEDLVDPVVTLTGDSEIDVVLGGSYTDEGATAEDAEDGTLEVSSDFDDVVDFNMVGEYTVTYSATDAAGNVGTAERIINVYVAPENLVGQWETPSTGDGCFYDWTTTISTSSTDDTKIILDNFAGVGPGFTVDGIVSNTSITIASQDVNTYTIIGNGTVANDGLSIDFSYTITYDDNTYENCDATVTLK